MELVLVRHALPIRREVVDGPADPPLSAEGLAQAELVGQYLGQEKFDAVYASPMKRAYETAVPIAKAQGLEIVVEAGVAEFDRDSNEYVPIEQLKATNDPRWQLMVNGEWPPHRVDAEEFHRIVVATVERLIEGHASQRIAIVCHGGVINSYLSHVLGLESSQFFYPNYTSIHRVAAARSGERSIVTVNETAHLRGSGLPIGLFQK